MGHILVIEDEPHIRFILQNILETSGYQFSEADDGLEAMNLIQSRFQPFSLVVLDIRLPKMDGFEFLYRLRRQHRSLIPVLALTAHRSLCARIKEYGADECLVKPFKRKQLLNTVTRLINTQVNQTDSYTWQPPDDNDRGY